MEPDYYNNGIVKSIKELLIGLVMQQPLLEKKSTIAALELMPDNIETHDIYFGTGLSNPHELTKGLPFDFLLYPLIAAKVQKKLGFCSVHHLIADNHALINNFNKRDVRKVAAEIRKTVEDIIGNIGIENYHIYLSSEISTDKLYQKLLTHLENIPFDNDYARLEAADVEYFRITRNVMLKVGWKISGESKFDESSFDKAYKNGFGKNVVGLYTSPGKRFDDKKPNTVPYSLYANEINKRIIINKNEDVLEKVTTQNCSFQTLTMLKKHYQGIIRLFEDVCQKIPDSLKTTWERIQFINQFITL